VLFDVKKYKICEVNSSPGFEGAARIRRWCSQAVCLTRQTAAPPLSSGLERYTGHNVGGALMDYVVEAMKQRTRKAETEEDEVALQEDHMHDVANAEVRPAHPFPRAVLPARPRAVGHITSLAHASLVSSVRLGCWRYRLTARLPAARADSRRHGQRLRHDGRRALSGA
jgi:hypothetical protein